ncbi:hypothetical protein H9P43_006602 [Blastocladiella emersonii ATCC 22665]|nr:hypothetical protein H9P43_006602 [Blastocladiella emersonii ATCC 22665]
MPSAAICYGLCYPNTAVPTPGCDVDAATMSGVAAGMGIEDIQTITDTAAPVTREQVLGSLRELVAQAEPGDSLLFSFSGLGSQRTDTSGDEAGDGYDELLVTETGAVTDDEIRAVLASLPAGANLALVLDASNSESMADLDLGGTEIAGNVVVLAACAADRQAVGDAAGGRFTNALADVLANHPGISWGEAAARIDAADGSNDQVANVAANRAELLFEPAFAPVQAPATDADADAASGFDADPSSDVAKAEAALRASNAATDPTVTRERLGMDDSLEVQQFASGGEIRTYFDGEVAAAKAVVAADGSVVLASDSTHDGVMDTVARFDAATGHLQTAAADLDGDGFFETQLVEQGARAFAVYDAHGNVVQEVDADGDGFADADVDLDGDGFADADVDLDGDGEVDMAQGFDLQKAAYLPALNMDAGEPDLGYSAFGIDG